MTFPIGNYPFFSAAFTVALAITKNGTPKPTSRNSDKNLPPRPARSNQRNMQKYAVTTLIFMLNPILTITHEWTNLRPAGAVGEVAMVRAHDSGPRRCR